MMKKITVLFTVLVLLRYYTESSPTLPKELRTFNLEELVPLRQEFYPERLSVQWTSDTEYIYKDPQSGLKKYNAFTDTDEIFLNDIELNNLGNYSFSTFSEDGKYALLTANLKKVYRYSKTAEYAVYDLENKITQKLAHGPLQAVVWSNKGSLAYVKDNNVYYVPDVAHPEQVFNLTTKGVPGEMYYGVTDWVYEEEVFNAAEAMWFSPRGTYLAVASFNDTLVESAIFPYYGDPFDFNNTYPEMIHFKYPKAGRTNPVVGLRVFQLDSSHSEPLNIPAPVDLVGLDHILGRVDWASDQNLIVLWLNRRQNVSVLFNCDLQRDKCNMVKEQTEPNGWIDVHTPLFDSSGTKMVEIQPLYHGDQRYLHAARFNFDTLTTEDLSPGNSTVTDILGWNEETDTVYYVVAPSAMPWQRQLWSTSAGIVRCVSCRETSCHYVTGMFSPGARYAIVSCSAYNVPPKIYLYNSEKDCFNLVKDNKRLMEKLSLYKLPLSLFHVMSLGEDVNANVRLLLPPEMRHGKKYPLVVRVYAGPGTTRVRDNFDLEYYNTYLTANRSFIIASIDVRGSGVMGVEAMHAVNTALGTVEITDTIVAIRRLLDLYSFIDPKRVGVWGWSYGGFATTMMLIKDDEKMITCGAAVAPVTSWLGYDTIYTERYMDTPQANPDGYKRSDVTAAAEQLRGRRLLLVHGSADDNVQYQHSMQLARQLQVADIAFEQMSYTDENHSLQGVSRHFYHTLDHFWTECFYS